MWWYFSESLHFLFGWWFLDCRTYAEKSWRSGDCVLDRLLGSFEVAWQSREWVYDHAMIPCWLKQTHQWHQPITWVPGIELWHLRDPRLAGPSSHRLSRSLLQRMGVVWVAGGPTFSEVLWNFPDENFYEFTKKRRCFGFTFISSGKSYINEHHRQDPFCCEFSPNKWDFCSPNHLYSARFRWQKMDHFVAIGSHIDSEFQLHWSLFT